VFFGPFRQNQGVSLSNSFSSSADKVRRRRLFNKEWQQEQWEAAGWEKSHAEIRREWIRVVHEVATKTLGKKPPLKVFYRVVEAACPRSIRVPSLETVKKDMRDA
jgi:hypothetical protein